MAPPLVLLLLLAVPRPAGSLPPVGTWPDHPNGAREDAAVVVGIEKYAFVDPVPFAERDAKDVWKFLVFDRGVPAERVSVLANAEGTNDRIEREIRKRAAQAGPGGILWFYFAGHGAPDFSRRDGLLVGVDAQPDDLGSRSISRQKLLDALSASPAEHVVVLLDACFSGKESGGTLLARGLRPILPSPSVGVFPRGAVFTAARWDQTSGPLPEARHGLFTYFLLGALRGWGEQDRAGPVTVEQVYSYLRLSMGTVLAGGRQQDPDLSATPDGRRIVLARGLGEVGPDLPLLSVGQAAAAPVPAAAAPPVDGAGVALPPPGRQPRSGGWLGLDIQPIPPGRLASLGVTGGVRVAGAWRDGPAAYAGLGAGDVIVSFDGAPVRDPQDLRRAVAAVWPGTAVTLGVVRNGVPMSIPMRTGSLGQGCSDGHPAACVELGDLLSHDDGPGGGAAEAARLYTSGCGGGNAQGCTALGWLYETGRGVAQDYAGAARLYEQGCARGSGLGCNNLGALYVGGLGVPQSWPRAWGFYRRACREGFAPACRWLAGRRP